jgi:membrane-associated phospholipid phosphatase
VSSPTYSLEKTRDPVFRLRRTRRVLLVLLACCIQMIYIPTSNRVEGGIEPKLAIDIFPISAVWVLPYVLCYLLWSIGIAWIIFRLEDRSFRSFIAACMVTFTLGGLTFIFFPTYVPPAVLDGNDIFTNILRTIHEKWGRYDAFPSGHVYITTLLALFFSRWYPGYRLPSIVILTVVSLSTLFTGQHYILDVIGGYLVALAGYYLGLWWAGFYQTKNQTGKRSGKRIPSSSLN